MDSPSLSSESFDYNAAIAPLFTSRHVEGVRLANPSPAIDWDRVQITWSDGVRPAPHVAAEMARLSDTMITMTCEFGAALDSLRVLTDLLGDGPDSCSPDTSQPYPF